MFRSKGTSLEKRFFTKETGQACIAGAHFHVLPGGVAELDARLLSAKPPACTRYIRERPGGAALGVHQQF
jgi:hypothetical protein